MPIYITANELLNFTMLYLGIVSGWAIVKGLSND